MISSVWEEGGGKEEWGRMLREIRMYSQLNFEACVRMKAELERAVGNVGKLKKQKLVLKERLARARLKQC